MQSNFHRFKRLRELGVRNAVRIICNKIRNAWFYWRFKKRALARKTQHSWDDIARKHQVNFLIFWQQCASKSLPALDYSSEIIIPQADAYTQNIFDILGSGPYIFTQITWHEDIRLKVQNLHPDYTFDATSFYKDIQINTSHHSNITKDIKVPWELSRCQHLPILGQAFAATHDPRYAQTFVAHIEDWLEKNPYLIGINWLCPMEVAIRAINWIWAWHYLKNSPNIPTQFWESFTSSLYDHMHYLENNWEIFDTKTSNHYLSDLLGYLYLCWFFQDLPGIQAKRDWCIKELLKEFDRQVFDEGTDYESTTAYHCLVTEIFDHVALLCHEMDILLPKAFHAKLARMHEFIAWCSINEREMVRIGDDDSGRVIYFRPSLNIGELAGNKTFKDFGLSIIKTKSWHITLRHHAYKKQQPSAHFHNDVLSITLAINGIPIIIDPGSYLYTASTAWRNHFRSAFVHNGFYIQDQEPIPFDERLFVLNLPEKDNELEERMEKHKIIIRSSHSLYASRGLEAHRTLTFDHQELILTDTWQGIAQGQLPTCWNFTLHPKVDAHLEAGAWMFSHNSVPLCRMITDLPFNIHESWVAPEYGVKVKSSCLKASYSGILGNESKIVFAAL